MRLVLFWKVLTNPTKARRGEIEPTHDFTFSLIGNYHFAKIWCDHFIVRKNIIFLLIALFKAGSAGFISCRFSTSSSTTPRFLVIFINIILISWSWRKRLKPLFLRQMTWTSFTKATMRGRCSSTSKWVTTTERKDTKSLRMRLPLIIRLSHRYWYLSSHIYLHINHCQPEETDEDRAAHENLKKSKPSERSVVAMQAKYKVQVQVQAKYKVA